MAYWDSANNKIIHCPPRKVRGYPDWEELDCGCCNGIQWGGEYPRECGDCGGSGAIFRHIKSGVLAQYPGGRFLGKEAAHD